MCFLFPIPAQKSAVAYLEVAAASSKRRIIVGGHSKGGNLAMYAAAYCCEETQDRIEAVYNFDGPGFDEKAIAAPSYQRIRGKMCTYIPQSSIVGLLLEHEEQYIIVKSLQKTGYLQHDLFTWAVEKDHLVYLDCMTEDSRFLDQTLKGWIAGMDDSQREKFIDALYAILAKTNAHTLREMEGKWLSCVVVILSSLGDMDDKTWEMIKQCMALFIDSAKKVAMQMGEDRLGDV